MPLSVGGGQIASNQEFATANGAVYLGTAVHQVPGLSIGCFHCCTAAIPVGPFFIPNVRLAGPVGGSQIEPLVGNEELFPVW